MSIKKTKLHNLNIEYYERGKGDTIVFVHGAMGSYRFYRNTLDALSKKYHVVAPTLPGMGKSQGKGFRTNFETYTQIITEFVKEFSPKYAIGHSLGGATLANVLNENNYSVEKLILINSAGIKYDNFIYRTIRGWIGGYLEYYGARKPFPFSLDIIPEDFRRMFLRRPVDSLAIANVLRKLHIPEKFENLKIKTLILWGEDDTHIPLKKGKVINNLIPHSTLVTIPNAEHNWLGYQTNKFISTVQNFFSKN